MIIKPKIRGFICTTTHPVGCEANVKEQIELIKAKGKIANGPKKVLVVGSSSGYGLASRITSAFGSDAATIGVFFEKPALKPNRVQQVGTTQRHLISLLKQKAYIQKVSTAMHSAMKRNRKSLN